MLRVINDDLVNPHFGFERNIRMEIWRLFLIAVDGNLTHGDSMGNESTFNRGDVQYMSAGTGVYHSEIILEMKH